jgi:hypothetical protein
MSDWTRGVTITLIYCIRAECDYFDIAWVGEDDARAMIREHDEWHQRFEEFSDGMMYQHDVMVDGEQKVWSELPHTERVRIYRQYLKTLYDEMEG